MNIKLTNLLRFILTIGFAVSVFVFVYVGTPWLYERCMKFLLKRKAVKSKTLVLTFDDGPGSRLTPTILDLLAEYDVKASFFLTGCVIAGKESVVKRIADEGHEICSHGYKHVHHWKVSPFRSLSDVKRGWEAIDSALGTERGVYPFRPPYGKLNLISLLYLLARKAFIVLWTIESGDRTMSKINPSVLRSHDIHRLATDVREMGGAVVLAHDANRRNPDTEAFTLDSIRAILAMAKETGMEIMTVSELLCRKK